MRIVFLAALLIGCSLQNDGISHNRLQNILQDTYPLGVVEYTPVGDVSSISFNRGTVMRSSLFGTKPTFVYHVGSEKENSLKTSAILNLCSKASRLNVSGCVLDSKFSFSKFSKLEYLNLSFCGITTQVLDTLPPNKNLIELHLTGNKIDWEKIDFERFPDLQILYMDGENLGSNCLEGLLKKNRKIKKIYLRGGILKESEILNLERKLNIKVVSEWPSTAGVI